MNFQPYLKLAKAAAKKAGEIQLRRLGRLTGFRLKGVANLVTQVDLLCEEAVIGMIRRQFPDHAFLAEERGQEQTAPSDFLWVIDPLDGTTNYAHGYPLFCVSIGLVKKGRIEVGVVFDALHRELFTAIRGRGAFLNGKRIRVSRVARLEESLLCTGFSYDRGERLRESLDAFVKLLPYPQAIRRDGCAALDICYTACGRYDGFWEHHLNPWDVAAGTLILEEAGGKVSDLQGRPISIYEKIFFGSNSRIHEEVVRVLGGLEGGPNIRRKAQTVRATKPRSPSGR
jgi:myo-inositol-1(or 4)-monophosphatase